MSWLISLSDKLDLVFSYYMSWLTYLHNEDMSISIRIFKFLNYFSHYESRTHLISVSDSWVNP